MKNVLFAWLLCCALCFVGCDSAAKPQDVAIAQWQAFFKADAAKYASYFALPADMQENYEIFSKKLVTRVEQEMYLRSESLKERGGLAEIQILDTKQTKNEATVSLRFKFGNGEIDETTSKLVFQDGNWKVLAPSGFVAETLRSW